MEHVMSQAPGYERLKAWVAAPIMPTPAGFANILARVSKELKMRVLAIDVGGATTDVFTAEDGNVFRTVSANLGLSYSIMNVVAQRGLGPVKELMDLSLSDAELWNRIGNKHINPTMLAPSPEDMKLEWALATLAIREAVGTHFEVMSGSFIVHRSSFIVHRPASVSVRARPCSSAFVCESLTLTDYGMVVGSGGILSHSPRDAAARILVDALGGDTTPRSVPGRCRTRG